MPTLRYPSATWVTTPEEIAVALPASMIHSLDLTLDFRLVTFVSSNIGLYAVKGAVAVSARALPSVPVLPSSPTTH